MMHESRTSLDSPHLTSKLLTFTHVDIDKEIKGGEPIFDGSFCQSRYTNVGCDERLWELLTAMDYERIEAKGRSIA